MEKRKVWTKLRLKTKWDFSIKVNIKFLASQLWKRRMSGGGTKIFSVDARQSKVEKHARESIRKQLLGTAGNLSRVPCRSFEVVAGKPNYRLDDCWNDRKTSLPRGLWRKHICQEAFTLNFQIFECFSIFFFRVTRDHQNKPPFLVKFSISKCQNFLSKLPPKLSSCDSTKPHRNPPFWAKLPFADVSMPATQRFARSFLIKGSPWDKQHENGSLPMKRSVLFTLPIKFFHKIY